jgi:hypothetical protein
LCLLTTSTFAVLTLPPNITAEATGADGAVVSYTAGADGMGDDENGRPIEQATCSPASGSRFPLGTTTVNCSASSGATGSFTVTIADTTGPALNLPSDFTVQGTNQGASVAFSASATDLVDGAVGVSCSPGSGAFLPVGTTTVTCTASDSRFNNSQGSFLVSVVASTPPPTLNDITAEATGPHGAVVTFSTGGGDGDDENGRPLGHCAPASGSIFPLGETSVTCSNGTFNVKVVDTTGPVLSLPADIVTQNPNVTYTASAMDLVDGAVAITCVPPSGSAFSVGTTTVNCSASDSRGNDTTDSFSVTVEQSNTDTEAPVITSLSASPDALTPPNGKLVTVTITAAVTDNVDASPYVGVFDVSSNETITGDDWNVISPLSVELRAARDPQGSGRVYTVWVEAIDDAGNRSISSVTVTVAHDQGNADESTVAKKWLGMRKGN